MVRRTKERSIIASAPARRPYAAKFTLLLEPTTRFGIDAECTFLLERDMVVRVVPSQTPPSDNTLQSWDVHVEGFSTAGEAEREGLRVVLGFLWAAVFGRFGVRLSYKTPLPCEVYLRTEGHGLTMFGIATVSLVKGIANIVAPVDAIAKSRLEIEPRLLLSLELFTSARLESTQRSKYLGLVSSIEPLVSQEKYQDLELEAIIRDATLRLGKCNLSEEHLASLRGRIDGLRQESISVAIRSMVQELMPEDHRALETIEEAYHIRSKILHEGSTDTDLSEKGQEVEAVIRSLLERRMRLYLS